MQTDSQPQVSFLHFFQEPEVNSSDEPAGLRLGEIVVRTDTREEMAQTTGLFATSFRLF
jgi:hypothetical protein